MDTKGTGGSLDTLLVIVTYRSESFADSIGTVISDHLSRSAGNRAVLVENSGSAEMAQVAADLADAGFRYVDGPNDGFAPAVNRGYAVALETWGPPAYVALVNPDVLVGTETMARLRDVLEQDPTIGICGPRLVGGPSADSAPDRGCARRDWTPLSFFCESAGLGPLLDRWGGERAKSVDLAGARGLRPVDVTSGALLMVRAAVFGGGLDTRLPMYLEDQELCLRARRLGYTVVVDADTTVTHVGAASRKAAGSVARRLQLMELATSPALAMQDARGQSLGLSRVLAAAGGATRMVLASLRGMSGADRSWVREQMALGAALMRWSVSPLDREMPTPATKA